MINNKHQIHMTALFNHLELISDVDFVSVFSICSLTSSFGNPQLLLKQASTILFSALFNFSPSLAKSFHSSNQHNYELTKPKVNISKPKSPVFAIMEFLHFRKSEEVGLLSVENFVGIVSKSE